MYEGLFQDETEQALEFRAANPRAPEPPKASAWSQAAEILKAIPKGIGQAALQTTRNVQRVPVAGNPLAMSASEQEDLLQDSGVTTEAVDRDLRRGVEALKPDPVTATTASRVLQDGARVLSKVGMYGLVGGGAGAVVGTGLDEGLTGRRELMDQGVDAKTATKIGAVRGAAMAAGVALPVVGSTVIRTAGLVAVGGPGLFMAEQATTRAILEAAEYPALALQYDPTDPVGLGLSLLVPGAVGAVVHRARAKAAAGAVEPAGVATAKPVAPADRAPLPELLRSMPELQDAAMVAHRSHVVDAHLLADPGNVAARQSHVAAFEAAAKAMDEGAPVRVDALELDPVHAAQAMERVKAQMDAAEAELAPLREAEDFTPAATTAGRPLAAALVDTPALQAADPLTSVRNAVEASAQKSGPDLQTLVTNTVEDLRATQLSEAGPARVDPLQARVQEIARTRPDLMVRMDDDGGPPMRASELMDEVQRDTRLDQTDSKAFAAAVECFLRTGT